MTRHTGWQRSRASVEGMPTAQSVGRELMGMLLADLQRHGLMQGKRSEVLPDGTVVIAKFDGTTPVVTVIPGGEPPAATPRRRRSTAQMWLPQGFVVRPADDANQAGWGTPVVPSEEDGVGPYDPPNLAPGLDVSRWTPAGGLGDVLLTRVEGGGYPPESATICPLIYDRLRGIRLDADAVFPVPGVVWWAYRIEFAAWSSQSPSADAAEDAAIVLVKRGIFEQINAHRVTIGRDPLLMPIRGYYDSAQASAEVMAANSTVGHYSDRYPEGYRSAADRATRDGWAALVPAENADSRNAPTNVAENMVANGTAEEIGTDPWGQPIFAVTVNGAAITATQAVSWWLGSPAHKANIESEDFDGHTTSTFVGVKRNYAAQHFVGQRDQWISCGNRHWRSRHAEIPILSWFGFASLNLGWETWPVGFNNISAGTPPPTSNPVVPLGDFVTEAGHCWLNYWYGRGAHQDLREPAMDSRIFARGRTIAVAPRGGLVWAAAIQRHEVDEAIVYRLVALVHQDADQDADVLTNGMTAILRVWYCDIPAAVLASNPELLIRGVYGEEDEGFPWDRVDNPWSWRGGLIVDVGTSTGAQRDLLKYTAQWVFNSTGTQAVCLRDCARLADYVALHSFGTYKVALGLEPTGVTLDILGEPGGDPVLTKTWLGLAPGGVFAEWDWGDPFGPWLVATLPAAAGYDADDRLTFAHDGVYVPPIGFTNVPDQYWRFLAYGTYEATWAADDWDSPRVTYSSALLRESPDAPFSFWPQVLDIRDRMSVVVGSMQRYTVAGDVGAMLNDAFDPCWIESANDVIRVTIRRDQVVLADRWFGNPDNVVPNWELICHRLGPSLWAWSGTHLPVSLNDMVVPSYSVDADGNWIVTALFTPQPDITYTVEVASTNCQTSPGNPQACTPTPSSTFGTLAAGDVICRGGIVRTSITDADTLLSLTGVSDAGARFLYSKVV